MDHALIYISIFEAFLIALLLRKNFKLQREIDDECSAELAEMQEYARYLESQLKK